MAGGSLSALLGIEFVDGECGEVLYRYGRLSVHMGCNFNHLRGQYKRKPDTPACIVATLTIDQSTGYYFLQISTLQGAMRIADYNARHITVRNISWRYLEKT